MTDADLKRILFIPCESKEALRDWIDLFLGIRLPDGLVDLKGPNPSNCSPMEAIWRIYKACRDNATGSMPRVMVYAARASFKTLAAAILEVLAVLHLNRDVGHMAAVESQSENAQNYVKDFFDRYPLREFKKGDSKETTTVIRYEDKDTGANITYNEWSELPTSVERARYRKVGRYIKIVICTMRGANSLHVPFLVVDEVDVVQDPKAYKQAKFIPTGRDGVSPITLLISTRKSSTGLVQKELDEAHKTGLEVWHWNLMDVTERCPPGRHLPMLPKIPIWHSDETMEAVSQADYEGLTEDAAKTYQKSIGYAGCLSNCKMFAVCRGQLASQKDESKALKTVVDTYNTIRADADTELIAAELMCWRPSSKGLIFPRLDAQIHKLSAQEIAEKITGERQHPNFSKNELLQLCKTRGMRFVCGIDWGMTHNFVVVVGVCDGPVVYVIDCHALGDLDDPEKVDYCDRHIKWLEPEIWPDTESPSTIKTFRKAGYKMRSWKKNAGSLLGGIQLVRAKLRPVMRPEPELFFLKGDPGVEHLFDRVSRHSWKLDAAGNPTDVPSETNKDESDALRYCVMNLGQASIHAAPDEHEDIHGQLDQPPAAEQNRNAMSEMIRQLLGGEDATEDDPALVGRSGGENRFRWEF